MQHISALNLSSSFRWKFLHRNSERYVWNSALDVPNCRRSFRFSRIHIFSIFWVWISGLSGLTKLASWMSFNNLRRPFENCEFTPLLYRITWLNLNFTKSWRFKVWKMIISIYHFLYANIPIQNTNLLLSIMTPNILSRIIKWITYIWFHIDWFDWFYKKERKKDNITNE